MLVMRITNVVPMIWAVVPGQIFQTMISSWPMIMTGLSDSLFGQDSIIWVNRLLMAPRDGRIIVPCSAYSIWRVFPKTAIISIAASGTIGQTRSISCLTGLGLVGKGKLPRYSSIRTIPKRSFLSMVKVTVGGARANSLRSIVIA